MTVMSATPSSDAVENRRVVILLRIQPRNEGCRGHRRSNLVHADDLADAYLRAGESGLHGEVFNVTDRSRWSVGEMLNAVARVTAYAGKITFIPVAEAAKTMGDFAECLALDQHADSRKAVRLLGWQPKHGGFVDDAETYYMSWQAAQ